MNRRKKTNQILKSRAKKKNAKATNSNKPKYISKAERARLEEQLEQSESLPPETVETVETDK